MLKLQHELREDKISLTYFTLLSFETCQAAVAGVVVYLIWAHACIAWITAAFINRIYIKKWIFAKANTMFL